MAEYIDRKELIETIQRLKRRLNTGFVRQNLTQKDIMRVIADFPAADVAPVEERREYLEAEAEGRLVVLPCKIDAPIYLIFGEKEPRKRMKYRIEEYDIDHFTIGGTMIPMITACSKENEWEELIDGTQNGFEYFLTREDAEAALAKGGDRDA